MTEKPFKMAISRERLWEKIKEDPDLEVEAGIPHTSTPSRCEPPEELIADVVLAIHEGLGGNGWAYSNYAGDELVTERSELNKAAMNAIKEVRRHTALPDAAAEIDRLKAENEATQLRLKKLTDALSSAVRMLEAVRLSSGLRGNQIQRLNAIRAALARERTA